MTAQQTAAKRGAAPASHKAGQALGMELERKRIRDELLAVGVIREGVWVYRESVIAAIKKATRATRKGRR